jgi:hypothetical protein
MCHDSTDLIQDVRQEFEKLLDLVTGPQAHHATVNQMERTVFRRVLQLGYQLLQLFIVRRVAAEPHAPYTSPTGQTLAYHSQQDARYFSVFGKLAFRRAYFYAPGTGGVCPLDAALSLPARCYSDFLMEITSLLAVDGVFETGAEVVHQLLGVSVPKRAIEMAVAEHSAAVANFYEQRGTFPIRDEGPILVAQADGKGVPMVRSETVPTAARRGKGDKKTRKKEAIATAVDTIAPYRRTPQMIVDALFKKNPEAPAADRPAPCHKQISASLKGKAAALKRLAERVALREGRHIRARVALTDGALALQQHMQAHLPHFTLVLDVIHVDEYVWKAGTALYGETDPQRAVWVEEQMLDILSSRVADVIQRLEDKANTLSQRSQAAKTLRQVAHYFRRNQAYMDYAQYLQQGWPIGTGVIEGVCRHLIKDRLELAGMRWTVPGAEALLALRAVHENSDWQAFHEFRRAQQHQTLYDEPFDETWIALAERLEIKQF